MPEHGLPIFFVRSFQVSFFLELKICPVYLNYRSCPRWSISFISVLLFSFSFQYFFLSLPRYSFLFCFLLLIYWVSFEYFNLFLLALCGLMPWLSSYLLCLFVYHQFSLRLLLIGHISQFPNSIQRCRRARF